MTPAQLQALQAYVVAVTQYVTGAYEHEWRVRRILDARKELEAAFGVELPAKQPTLPNLL